MIPKLASRLHAKADLLMRKLDELLSSNNRESRPDPRKNSLLMGFEPPDTQSSPSSRTSLESKNMQRSRAAPLMPFWTDPVPPEAEASSETSLPTTVSHDFTIYAPMFEPLNKSLETFITKLPKSTEGGERSRRTLKKPESYKDESDGCLDTWIEGMSLHFEQENFSKKQEGTALTSYLEGTALNCVMDKKTKERASARKIFNIVPNRFDSGVHGYQEMFLDDLKLLRRKSNSDKRISETNIAINSKFMDRVRSEELKTMLATQFTMSRDCVPSPDDLRMKSREYLLIKPRTQTRYNNYGKDSRMDTGTGSS